MTDTRPSDNQPISLALRMSPPWVFIDEIRRFVESFCACTSASENREAQLALAVHELMQNAVPHARGDSVELTLEVDPIRDRVEVSVTNACSDEEYAALASRIDRMNHEPDALKQYLAAMAETPTAARGGLGLPRIRFEAQLDLSVSRTSGRITVHASGRLRAPSLTLLENAR